MSGEDDTFDIDIYGDEGKDTQQPQQNDDEDNLVFDDDYAQDGYDGQQDGNQNHNGSHQEQDAPSQQAQFGDTSANSQQQQKGTKRKAEDDGFDDNSHNIKQETPSASNFTQPMDPNATPALKISDLHWWTTEEDVRAFCKAADAESQLKDISFGEHKINGKSRGEAYLEFSSVAAANAVKHEIEKKETKTEGEEPKRLNSFHIFFTTVGNPFRGRDSGAQSKKDFTPGGGRGGAYNPNFSGGRGGFNRGGGGYNRGGGGFNRGGGFQQQQQGGWNNNMGAGGGYGAPNPMMNNPMMMGMGGMGMGFNNMGRGGMMGGRGGMGMGGPMNMGMGGGGRGGMMGGRGGWGAGGGNFQQGGMGQGGYGGGGGFQQGGGMGMQGNPNKRMRQE